MGIFHDPMRAGIAIIRALAGLDPRTPGAPIVARIAIVDNAGTEIMRVEVTEAGVENAVTVLEDAADRTAQDARLAALETPATQPAHELSADEMDLFDQLDKVFSHVDLDDLTRTVLDATKPSDRFTVTQAIDGMFGHIPHWDAEDGDVL
ncbi:hypothetical protein [Streptomyces sp. BE133]|uniref:hypothetical protein n=1 Tax=Streptomyces sp. BE133 TaxID=3002523 RepID=UPI002E76FBBD|nr:hypothetical protein [Streptomyces sp. BE133]MEE1812611.1 hypothetical protein [Streptomyces sp. BE133]